MMHFINYKRNFLFKLETNNLQYNDGKLIHILDFELDDLKIDKKIGKILLFITLIISTNIKKLLIILMICIYQLKVFLDIL